MANNNLFATCHHLDGRCLVPKKAGSRFCTHHCCPVCPNEKSSTATYCPSCQKDKGKLGSHSPPRISSPTPKDQVLPTSNDAWQRNARAASGDSNGPPAPCPSGGLKRFQNAARRVSKEQAGGRARARSPTGPALNVSPQDADNLRVLRLRGLLTEDQFSSQMAVVNQMASRKFERPINTPSSTSEIGGIAISLVQRKNFELVYKYSFDYTLRKWDRCILVVSIERTAFAEGNLRRSYRMKDLTKPEGEDDYVAKSSKDRFEDIATYFLDIEMQAMCQAFAEEYNRRTPPKNVEFLEAFLIECFQRPDNTIFACEPYIKGDYVKYSSNWGFVSSHGRNTPHAFSHFTHYISGGKYIVVDVQGVNDKYTDPQMHSTDGQGFGKGNCGQEGINKFFATHQCNVICKALGLTTEVKSMAGTMVSAAPNRARREVPYDRSPDPADLEYYGITEQDYRLLMQRFQAVDKDQSGEIGVQELGTLCESLQLRVSPKQYVSLLQAVDKDGNGRISLAEFLTWWTGKCGGAGA